MTSLKVKSMLQYLLLGFAVIPALIVALIGFFAMQSFSSATIETNATTLGRAQNELLSQHIGTFVSNVTVLSGDPVMAATLNGDDSKAKDAVKSYINDNVKNIVVINNNGDVQFDYAGIQSKGKPFFGLEDIKSRTFTAGQTFISPIYDKTTADGYDNSVYYLASHIADKNKNPIGTVIEVVSVKGLQTILEKTSYTTSGASGYVAITDGSGKIMNFASNVEPASLSDVGSNLESALKASLNDNSEINYNMNGYVGCYANITGVSNANWKWVTFYPAGQGFGAILVPALIAIAVALVCVAVCIFISTLATKSIISPINEMIANMDEIKNGDRDKRFDLKTKNEFGDMSEVFNSMLDEVCLSEELHRTISDISDNMLFEWDFHKEIMYVSDNFKERFNINPEEAQLANGKFLDKLMTEADADQYKRDISTLLKNKTGHSAEYQMSCKNGATVWFAVRALCITDRLGEPLRVMGVVTDIDNEKKLELQLSERASYDFLSQLYNRSTFERELQGEIERNAHTKVGVLFIDVDDFKFINDRFGHSVGDEVIKYVANCIKQRVKGSGFAGRFGGDEFVLCITDPEQIKDIENLSLDLIDELYNGYHSDLADVFINVKASIGIALCPDHGNDGKTLVAAADEAMYFVKKNGKANYHIYEIDDSQLEGLQHTL